jgi:hypothetical protein
MFMWVPFYLCYAYIVTHLSERTEIIEGMERDLFMWVPFYLCYAYIVTHLSERTEIIEGMERDVYVGPILSMLRIHCNTLDRNNRNY